MKQTLSLILVVSFLLTLCACRADMTGAESSVPTEEQPQPIQIIAPFDIYEGDAQAAGDVQLTVQEDYKLIQDMNSDDYPYMRHYEHLTSRWWQICICPIILEEDIKDRPMSYTMKTNFAGFFDNYKAYHGKEVSVEKFINWCGPMEMPVEATDTDRPQHIWVDILIKADDHIVGFAVIEIVDWVRDGKIVEDGYTVADRYTEYYPLIDGQFQEVDEEFVWQRVEQYHKYAE